MRANIHVKGRPDWRFIKVHTHGAQSPEDASETLGPDFDAALRLRPKMASALYGRGTAELKKGQASAGNADIAEAKRIDPAIVQEYEHYGVD